MYCLLLCNISTSNTAKIRENWYTFAETAARNASNEYIRRLPQAPSFPLPWSYKVKWNALTCAVHDKYDTDDDDVYYF